MSGTGKWAQRGVPHRGWTCIDIEDAEEQEFQCEMCEATLIRYLHVMEHERYPEVLRAGCICAGNMERDLAAARQRETDFKKRQARRSRWLIRDWRTSRHGNDYLNTDGFNVVIYPKGRYWSGRVQNRESGAARFLGVFINVEAAKLAGFDLMSRMK
jgi:hypothetical protein